MRAIRDRGAIERFLRLDSAAHVYALADLDDALWPDTRWFAAASVPRARRAGSDGASGGELDVAALCLVLEGLALPIVYAVCPPDDAPTGALLEALRDELPQRFFYNLGPGLVDALRPAFRVEPHGSYWKMHLVDPAACEAVERDGVVRLGVDDFDELRAFLDGAYLPHEKGGLFFDARMLASGCYRGVRESGGLLAVGGVHVHSPALSVAGIGNVVTLPEVRGRGLARRVSAAVVRALRDAGDTGDAGPPIETIGLNVNAQNAHALRCYRRLGFRPVCPYEEGVAVRF